MDKEVVVSQFSCSVMPDSFRSQGLQHARCPVHHQIPELTQTHVHHVSDAIHHLLFCRPLLFLPSIFPSIRVFSNESVLHIRWLKYWSFSFAISPSSEYSRLFPLGLTGLISLLSKGLSRVFLYHGLKASVLWCPALFTVQFSHPYMITGSCDYFLSQHL